MMMSSSYSGTALSLVISNVASPVILITYVWFRGMHKLTWKGWSWESLTEWGLFFKLGVPGLFMLCFEWWTYEISAIVAGTISELQLAVNTVLMQIGTILFAVSELGARTKCCPRSSPGHSQLITLKTCMRVAWE